MSSMNYCGCWLNSNLSELKITQGSFLNVPNWVDIQSYSEVFGYSNLLRGLNLNCFCNISSSIGWATLCKTSLNPSADKPIAFSDADNHTYDGFWKSNGEVQIYLKGYGSSETHIKCNIVCTR